MGPTDHVEIPPGSPKPLQTPCLWFRAPLGPSSHPHPLPRSSSLCKSPWLHLDLCRWPVVDLEANLSPWVCEKAQECKHLALPEGSSQETVSTDCLCCVDRCIWASEFSPRRNWVHGAGVSLKNVWKISKSLSMWQCTSLPRSVCKNWREWLLL